MRSYDLGKITRSIFSMVVMLGTAQSAKALDKADDIDTNRPSFCQSALVVPDGTIQLENGALYQSFQHRLTYVDLPENEVRVGLLKHLELQVFTPDMVLLNQSASTLVGATGLHQIGLKKQLGPYKRLTASVIVGANVPTGAKYLTGTAVQPSVSLPYSIQLTKNYSFCGMQSIHITDSKGNILYEPFVMLSRAVGPRASFFTEYAASFQQNAHKSAGQIAHFGGIYKLNQHNQLDFQFGFGLSKTAPTAFVGVGYSYRFDKLPWGG